MLEHRMPVKKELKARVSYLKRGKELELANWESVFGKVFVGNVVLNNGARKKVAIKEIELDPYKAKYFEQVGKGVLYRGSKKYNPNSDYEYTPEGIANLYNETIIILRNAGIPLPKMKAIVWQGKLLLISQYFGNAKRGKLTKKFFIENLNSKQRENYVDLLARIYSAGFVPSTDVVEFFSGKEKGFVPLDIDSLVVDLVLKKQGRNLMPRFFQKFLRPMVDSFDDEYACNLFFASFFRKLYQQGTNSSIIYNMLEEYESQYGVHFFIPSNIHFLLKDIIPDLESTEFKAVVKRY